MSLRMKWFVCSCGKTFEDVVEQDETTTTCECGEKAELLKDLSKQWHREGYKYSHVSWSQWNAGD